MRRGSGLALIVMLIVLGGCAPRVNLVTGTTIGLKATPGDGQSRPPQVTLGYKRAEVSFVPTEGKGAKKGTGGAADTDAASTLATIHFSTTWFGHTELDSFVATGPAAQKIVAKESKFGEELARVTLGVVPDAIKQRQLRLNTQATGLTEDQAKNRLDLLGYPTKPGKTAAQSLQDYILDARSETSLERIDSAFNRATP